MLINICIIKQVKTAYPSVFEDSAHCISYSLKRIGFENVISYNTIDPTIPNIVLGIGAGNTVPIDIFRKIAQPDNTIIFNLEQTGSNSSFIKNEYLQLLADYVSFDYNNANIQATTKLTQKSIQSSEFSLAPFFDLATTPQAISNCKINYDYAFYGAMNESRSQKIAQLENMGLRIKKIFRAYGEFLTDAIMDCKAILNLHYYDTHIFEAARALRPTAMGIPILSEPSTLPATVDWTKSGVLFIDGDFLNSAVTFIQDHDQLTELSRKSLLFTKSESWLPSVRDVMQKSLIELKNR